MITREVVQQRVQILLPTESLNDERIAYLEGLIHRARAAAAACH
jgi:hypothetical protein